MKTLGITILLIAGITSAFTQEVDRTWSDAAIFKVSEWEAEGYTIASVDESSARFVGKVFWSGGYVYAWEYYVRKKRGSTEENGIPVFSGITLTVCDCDFNRSTKIQETYYDVDGKVLHTEESDFYDHNLTFAIPNSFTDRFIEAACAKAPKKSNEQFRSVSDFDGDFGDPNGDPDASILERISVGSGVVGGGLSNRGVLYVPNIKDPSQKTGRVVVNVCVDQSGKVISAVYTQRGSTTTDSDLRKLAVRSARKFWFSQGEVDKQCGTVTIDFKMQ